MLTQLMQAELVFHHQLIENGQWWRIIGGNFVHANIPHLLLNLSGLWIMCFLFIDSLSAKTFIISTLIMSLFVGFGLFYFDPSLQKYYGYSGVLYGLFLLGGVTAILSKDYFTGVSVIIFIIAKLLGLRKRIKNKQKDPDMSKMENKVKYAIAILLWSILAFVAAADFMWFFVPPEDFFSYLANPAEHMTLVGMLVGIALFIIVDVVMIKENFCVYICPYSRVQSVLYDDDTIMAVYDPIRGGDIYEGQGYDREKKFEKQKELLKVDTSAECTTCESCVTVCPTHIDIRKGLQLECINCLECVDACTTVMGALGKPSLVQWSSEKETLRHEGKTNYFRGKVIAYFTVLALVLVALFMMGSKKEHMLLDINKSPRLYKLLEKGVVQNDYIFMFANTDRKKHTYYFDIVGNDKIKIKRPSEPFSLSAGKKKKKVVVLEAAEPLVKGAHKDTPVPVIIRAYAVDDKEKIIIDRQAVFMYPSVDKLKK